MGEWRPIDTAPTDGTWFLGRKDAGDGVNAITAMTQWGKTSHVPLYGWCVMTDWNDGDPECTTWEPELWFDHKEKSNG